MLQRPRLSRREFPDCHRLNYAVERELGAAPPPPGKRPIGMTMRVLGFVVGALGGREFGLTVWLAVADRSWALVLLMAGAAVFGVVFLYVAFTGRDPIGRLAAGDRTALAANTSSIAASRPNER